MATEVKVPALGESITEVQVADWIRKVGDIVAVDEPIAEIDSDKATVELPAPVAGKIIEIKVEAGVYCNVGDVVVVIDETAAGEAPAPAETPAASEAPAATGGPVMPAAQRVLDQAGVDAATMAGTGPGGRVLKEDAQQAAKSAPATPPTPPAAPAPFVPVPMPNTLSGDRAEKVVPMSPIRRRIAKRLVEAQHNAALLTTFNEIDMGAVMDMRKRHKDAFLARHGVKLGFMSFFTRAVSEALLQVPNLNGEVRGQDIIERNYHDIGIAIGSGKGLVVPVLRDAQGMGFAEIEQRIADLAHRAQNKKLDLSELEGGTFTISNGGVYGSLLSTPIVNPPQSGVLGLHAIQDRAMVVDGEITVRPMMYVALTYDHRLVDGREGVSFLKHIKEVIEAPERLMLEI